VGDTDYDNDAPFSEPPDGGGDFGQPAGYHKVSVVDPIGRAFTRVGLVCFAPFKFSIWFGLAFAYWLVNPWYDISNFLTNVMRFVGVFLPQNFSPTVPSPPVITPTPSPTGPTSPTAPVVAPGSGTAGSGGPFDVFMDWFNQQGGSGIVAGVAIGSVLLFLVALGIMYLSCRAKFIVVDGVVKVSGNIPKPWREYKKEANQLFLYLMGLFLLGQLLLLPAYGGFGYFIYEMIQTQGVASDAGVYIFAGSVSWATLFGLVWFKVWVVTMDFVVPIQYIKRCSTWKGWGYWWREMFFGHVWSIILFYLMKLVLSFAAWSVVGTVYMSVMCFTCCLISFVPFIYTLLSLPVLVFMTSYTLSFFEQYGPQWHMMLTRDGTAECLSCGYDLRGRPDATACPECGAAVAPKQVSQLDARTNCLSCGYDLQGNPDATTCPECGVPIREHGEEAAR